MRHGSECAVVNRLDLVLVQDEDVELWTLGERLCVEDGQVVATQLDVAQCCRQAARHTRQAALGHVDVRQSRRRVEVETSDVCERIASQDQVQQVFQVTQGAPLNVVDTVVGQEQSAKRGQISERELGQ